MQKGLILLMAVLMTASVTFAFTGEKDKAEISSERRSEYSHSIYNVTLFSYLEENFSDLVDRIESVDVHLSETRGHYYTVYGEKDAEATVIFLKINEDDVVNETYTYIKESVLKTTTYYCREKENALCKVTTDWRGIICAKYNYYTHSCGIQF